jgi:predicted ATPase/signal transduction histidine kinase/CheY-like chemotaxis protein
MIKIQGYKVTDKIYEDTKIVIYEGSSSLNNLSVLIETLNSPAPPVEDVNKLKEIFLINNKLNKIKGVLKIIDLVPYNKNCALILEYFHGKFLRDIIDSGLNLSLFLHIAIKLSEILNQIHDNEIIHCNIKPDIILLPADFENSETTNNSLLLKVIGLGGSSFKLKDSSNSGQPNILDISMEYISPEQTGRMNRSVDYRTDFYSMGITFYEMLTGRVPFRSQDVMELIHFHIAKEPDEPAKINNNIPAIISDIVMKLISKDPEERYQSALGLKADLEICLDQYEKSGQITAFALAKRDIISTLQIPKKLYGRDSEIKILMDIFEGVCKGRSALAFVSGSTGTGKTSLINEIHIPVIKNNGYFTSSKFEHLIREIPYNAIIKAFKLLIRQLLAEKEEEITRWKKIILDAIYPNAGLLIDVIPELKLIIGEQESVPEVGPAEAQNRYNLYFQKFVRVFADKKHPLVLFLDDLQWADSASLNLIKVLITDPETKYLFIIGAYRDNEVNESHKLHKTIDEINSAGIKIKNINLKPLDENIVNDFVSGIIRNYENTIPLSSIIYKKTQGNPFFVIELIKTLYKDNLLMFDRDSGWMWDAEAIRQTKATDNVIELLANKFIRLPGHVQDKLKICACLGNNFDIEILSGLFNKSVVESAFEMSDLINEGFITFSGKLFKFSHDSVQEAVYSLMSDEEKNTLHFKIGKLVLGKTGQKDIGENIFYIVNQLNYGSSLLLVQRDKNEVAELNLLAGKKAKESTAYSSAVKYLQAGRALLSDGSWHKEYSLTFSIHRELAECEYLNGNFDEAERIFNILLGNTSNKIDKANVYNIMVILYTNIGNLEKAIKVGLEGLKLFGIRIPENPGKKSVLVELIKFKWNQRKIKYDEFFVEKELHDLDKIAFLEILTNIGTPAFYSNTKLFALVVLTIINYYLKSGNTSFASPTYIALGTIIGVLLGDYESGYKIGELALLLNEKYNNRRVNCQVLFMFAYFIQHWKKHTMNGIPYFRRAYKLGVESGNIIYSCHSINIMTNYRVILGDNLDEIFLDNAAYEDFIKGSKDPFVINFYFDFRQMYFFLKGLTYNIYTLNNNDYNEDKRLSEIKESRNNLELCNHLYVRILVTYLSGQYDKCYKFSKELDKLDIPTGTLFVPEHLYYYSLAISAIYKSATLLKKLKSRRILYKNYRALKKWADHCPENFLHKFYLMSAEMNALYGKKERAMLLYDKAIKYARDSKYLPDEAIANELAAKFYIETGHENIAKMFIAESCSLFQKWGATGKVNQIKEKYPEFFIITKIEEKDDSAIFDFTGEKEDIFRPESAHITDSSTLDVATILKVSHAISGEIDFDKLLRTIMKIALQNSGAQKAFLILEKDGKLFIEAEGRVEDEEVNIMQSVPVENSKDISQSIVNFVARTRENIVLNNASDSSFVDLYILENKPKSILCTNIGHYGKTIPKVNSILYLENNLTISAFTPERLEVLRAISTQFAISLENARLYKEQQTAVEKLKRLDVLKDEFLSNTSHELKTPLLGIIGLADSLIEGATGKLSGKTRENLSMIISSCKRLSNLVNDILDLSRIKNKDLMLQKKPVSIRQIADMVLVFSKNLIEGKSVELKNNIQADLPPGYADGDRLSQILYNLIGNAIKFTEKGEVKISASVLHSSDNGAGNNLQNNNLMEITVEDTGIGIPENKFSDIFNYFEQADGSISRKYGGAGLGLSITKELVELHGGTIRVESRVGTGSSFIFSLPVYSSQIAVRDSEELCTDILSNPRFDRFNYNQKVESIAEKNSDNKNEYVINSSSNPNKGSATILVVDDEIVNLRVLEYQLGLAGYNVITANNSSKAIGILETEKLPDIVLLDIMMPGMSGYEVCAALRKRYSLYELPILMFTAKNQVMDIVAGFEAGANDYLPKPFDKRELLARVNTLITLKRTVKEFEESRFKNLHNRMNPHFLFNSIHAIHALIRTDAEKADRGIIKLAEIYRYLMDTSLSSLVQFEQEWLFVESYLEFEKIRFADVLTYKIEMSGDFSDIMIPPLTIQPLVENSIKHGLRQKMELGLVEIYAERKDNFIKIIVADDGTSIKNENLFTRSLGNIKDRLKFHFKESDVILENREKCGVKATITFAVG